MKDGYMGQWKRKRERGGCRKIVVKEMKRDRQE